MEHRVYICSWSRSPTGYTLWVKSLPHISASAPTYVEAEERLIEAIQNAGGAIHAVFELEPPLPKSILEEKYSSPEIYLIGGDDRFETDASRGKSFEIAQEKEDRLRWIEDFYDKPLCRKCRHTSGRRNDKPITLKYAPDKYDGAFGSIGTDGGPQHQLVSEDFLLLLTPDERRGLEFQRTIGKGRKQFYELVGPEGPPHVAVAGLRLSGWQCTQCDNQTWGYWVDGMTINSFVARSDLPALVSGVFTVGTFPEIELAVTASRWKQLLDHKGTRGFVSRLLGVVPDYEVMRRPELPTYEERLRQP